jgi:hypothetical protein
MINGERMIIEGSPYTSLDSRCLRDRFSRRESNGGLVIARQVVGFSRLASRAGVLAIFAIASRLTEDLVTKQKQPQAE